MSNSDELADQVHRLITAYEKERGAMSPVKVEGFLLAVKGQQLDLVKQAVDDFLSGKVGRKPSARGKLPTSEEFGGYIRDLEAGRLTNAAGDIMLVAPAFGPLWGAKLYQRLLAGPDDPLPLPSKFIKAMIDKGGEEGEVYRLHHQAMVGFKSVNMMFAQAADGRPSVVEKTLEPAATAMEPVPTDGYRIGDWRNEHGYRGWPWFPPFGQQRVVYLPKGGPAELPNLEKVLKSLGKAG